MASITIRNLDNGLKSRLRLQAAQNNRSIEEEAHDILRMALAVSTGRPQNLVEAIRSRAEASGGVELELPARKPARSPPTFA